MSGDVQTVTSRDNPLLVRLRRLARHGTAYRKEGVLWIEGEHLCAALLARGRSAGQALISESAWQHPALRSLATRATRVALLPDALFAGVSALDSPAGLGFVIEAPVAGALQATTASVVLDRVQDAGNVGSILRSAAAMGFAQVVALEGTAGLWSPKVLRAAMGAHFGLNLVEGVHEDSLSAFELPLLAASAHADVALDHTPLPFPCAWVLGHEGQGVAPSVLARCVLTLRIPQPGGEESLNVAAAAAICLYASRRKGGTR
jgi:TrmH family RNA methyltransferase